MIFLRFFKSLIKIHHNHFHENYWCGSSFLEARKNDFLFGYFMLTYPYFVNIFDAYNDTKFCSSCRFQNNPILIWTCGIFILKLAFHSRSFEGHSERFGVILGQILWQLLLLENVTFIKITFSLLMDTNYKYSTFKQIPDLRSILRSISFLLLRILQDQIVVKDPPWRQ